ncbi:MAG: hypothetical protein ACRC14_03765 [Paracoccaceae bacterium]
MGETFLWRDDALRRLRLAELSVDRNETLASVVGTAQNRREDRGQAKATTVWLR